MSAMQIVYGYIVVAVIVSTLTLLVSCFLRGGGDTNWLNGEHISRHQARRHRGQR